MNPGLKEQLQQVIHQQIVSLHPVSGGDINQAALITFSDNSQYFVKYNSNSNRDMFEKEALGLKLLRRDSINIHIPEVIDYGYLEEIHTGYLLIEYISAGRESAGFFERFGRELAAMHKITAPQYGLDHDNYIGRLPQSNHHQDNWPDFFIRERIEPQLKMAQDSQRLPQSISQQFEKLYAKLPDIFPDEPASLLHGDLWSGNYLCNDKQEVVLIDPAVYFGHREMELAFTQLFGGFGSRFYDSYHEAYPLQPGFRVRKDIYNLYPLLVHTNLFGGGYAGSVTSILSRYA